MRVTLDIQQIRNAVSLLRHALTIRSSDDGGGGAERAKMLIRLQGVVTGWLEMLQLCSADASDAAALKDIVRELAAIADWIDEARVAGRLTELTKRLKARESTAQVTQAATESSVRRIRQRRAQL